MNLDKPTKVLYVHHGSGQGGAANSLLYLLRNLDRSRFQPAVACNYRFPQANDFFKKNGFPTVHLPVAPFVHTARTWKLTSPRGMAEFLRWLVIRQPVARRAFVSLLRNQRPDLVHLNGLSILPLAPIAQSKGIPVVQHVREPVNDGLTGARRKWLKALAQKNADHIIYICADNQQRLTGKCVNSSVIYNPVDFTKFKTSSGSLERQRFGLPGRFGVLLFPGGSLFDIKGIIPFLRALAIVRQTFSEACAIIPGLDGAPMPRDKVRAGIERTITDLGLEPAIVRLPFTSDIEEYYAASDIVVAPFVRPHFSRAVIEAGAMAKAVIGSRIGGITEVLDHGRNGYLVNPGDEADLARSICHLIENPEIASRMGAAGRDLASQRFSATVHAQRVMEVYDEVLHRARRRVSP